jgi:hypothetical protein
MVTAMQIEGPERYRLTFTPDRFTVLCSRGSNKFSGIAMLKLPKLYIVSIGGKPVYVGTTKQAIGTRLRVGRLPARAVTTDMLGAAKIRQQSWIYGVTRMLSGGMRLISKLLKLKSCF